MTFGSSIESSAVSEVISGIGKPISKIVAGIAIVYWPTVGHVFKVQMVVSHSSSHSLLRSGCHPGSGNREVAISSPHPLPSALADVISVEKCISRPVLNHICQEYPA